MSIKRRSFTTFDCSKKEDILQCINLLNGGGVVVFPTDTVYGIGCNPFNTTAVQRIYKIKGRPSDKALPILAYSISDVEKIVLLTRAGKILGQMYWPGALTIVADLINRDISPKITAGKNSLGVRVPRGKCVRSLLRGCKYLIGTSANKSGDMPPRCPKEILSSPLRGFDALLNGGTIKNGIESTIVKLSQLADTAEVLREGAIKSREIHRFLRTRS